MKMKRFIRILSLALAAALLLPMTLALADGDGFSGAYTYNYDYWGELRESPDAYRVDQVIYSGALGLDTAMRRPQSLYVIGNDVYICDTGNNRILQLRRKRLHEKRVKAMLSESNPFFARRICRWIDHPEKDPDLTWAVQCGKYPSLLVYLKKAANQNR